MRVLFVGSYPPRECGIATFTRDLVNSVESSGLASCDVIAIDEAPGIGREYPREVVARIERDERSSYFAAAAFASARPYDVVCVQHEYGLFGGHVGSMFLHFVKSLQKPLVVSMHTVLSAPCVAMREIAQEIGERADKVVVLSPSGAGILEAASGVTAERIAMVHHGVPNVPFAKTAPAQAMLGLHGRKVVTTFGLLNRGKGIEYAIDAIDLIRHDHPEVLYLVLGKTHPGVVRSEGETYRARLAARIAERGLQDNVKFVDRYFGIDELLEYLGATDIYVTPYLEREQIVSGTLAYAVGCGKPVVSTPYRYAVDLLGDGRGMLCDFADAPSLALALDRLLGDGALREQTAAKAYAFGRQMTWENVAREYTKIFESVRASERLLPAFVA
jgi:glycosyltransferase involved in cell wall biosynthesis